MFFPEGKQKHVEQRQAIPEQNRADEKPRGQRRRAKLGHRKLNREQHRKNKNTDPDQPCQPIALIERGMHAKFEVSKFRRFKVSKLGRAEANVKPLKLFPLKLCRYPE